MLKIPQLGEYMRQTLKRYAPLILGVIATAAIAKVWGPFFMSQYQPEVRSYQDDKNGEFAAASNIARFFLNADVTAIKKGDYVRIVYADGSVYDFETSQRCSSVSSISCPILKATQRPSPTAPALRSQLQLEEEKRMARDTCIQQAYTYTFKTGYWEISYPDTGDWGTVITNGRWVSTGDDIVQSWGRQVCK